MERILHRDDFIGICSATVLGVFPRQFNRSFIRFGTAITEKTLVHIGVVNQQFRDFRLWLYVIEIGGVEQVACLLTDGLDDLRVAMS